MLELDKNKMIGKGYHRECYVHPEDESRCIKVITHGDLSETNREKSYYQLLAQKNISWQMLPKYYGDVETNMGNGGVFDLIRDFDGSVSKTLVHYFSPEQETTRYYDVFKRAHLTLRSYLLDNCIVTMPIKPKNNLFQRVSEDEGQFLIIDNIGNADFLPVCNYVDFLARAKIKRRWRRYEHNLRRDYPDNKMLHKLVNEAYL